jgi:hypothetical protein
MKAMTTVAFSLALIALLASSASGQDEVNLRVNLSTQPVYGGWQSRVTYFGLGNLYSTGNIRGGRAFRGNRNFLEDRYFSGSMTGFYRDSVGVSDVTGRGPSYGPGQPFYRPGSLSTSGSTVRRFTGGTAPVGFSYNPQRALASPFQTTVYTRAVTPSGTPTAAYPSARALRGLAFKLGLTSASDPTAPPGTGADDGQGGDTLMLTLPQPLTSEMLYAPRESDSLDDLLPDWLRTTAPPAKEQEEPAEGDWGVDLEERLRQEELVRQQEDAMAATRRPILTPIDLGELDREFGVDETDAETLQLPDMIARGRMRTRGSYAQYMELARLEMKIGAYRPAANAYRQAAGYQPFEAHQAHLGEAVARLLIKEYYIAAVMWRQAITGRPKAFGKEFRLTQRVDRPDQWKGIEKDLRTILEQSPTSRDHALCLATILVFSGRGADAAPYLKVVEDDPESAKTIRLLRQWATP